MCVGLGQSIARRTGARDQSAIRNPQSEIQESGVPKSPPERAEMQRCVLCGKSRDHVSKLILGLHGGICVECVDLCNDVIRGEVFPGGAEAFQESLAKPKEIAGFLSQYVVDGPPGRKGDAAARPG